MPLLIFLLIILPNKKSNVSSTGRGITNYMFDRSLRYNYLTVVQSWRDRRNGKNASALRQEWLGAT